MQKNFWGEEHNLQKNFSANYQKLKWSALYLVVTIIEVKPLCQCRKIFLHLKYFKNAVLSRFHIFSLEI